MLNNRQDWQFIPLNGETGDAFMGINRNERIFIKRNVSPFISALSAKGIAPKLKWTQRTYSGDLLTAQEWHDGRTLEPKDMFSKRVIHLIRSVHQSQSLLTTLQRIDNYIKGPIEFIDDYLHRLPDALLSHHFFNEIIQQLESEIDEDFYNIHHVVCHGDLNHHNFLLNNNNHLFLVDWERVAIADPISDLTRILVQYIPGSQWLDWLSHYDLEVDKQIYNRIRWYSQINALLLIKQFHRENRHERLNEMIRLLKIIYEDDKKYEEKICD